MYCTLDHGCGWLEAENAALAQGVTATITVAPVTFDNRRIYKLRYCVKFVGATGAEVLRISNGTTTYPVWDKNGETVKIGRLRRREPLYLKFISAGTAHFTLENCLYPICLKTPDVTAAI